MTAPRWYPDPTHRHDYRWWSGDAWSSTISDHGIVGADPPRLRRSAAPFAVLAVLALLIATAMITERGHDGAVAPANSNQTLVPGEFVPAGEHVVGPLGGSVVIDSAGTPVDGLLIDVPVGALAAEQSVAVSWAPLAGTDATGLVTPLSPLIRIDDGSEYASDVVEVTVPVTVPDGWVAMGFYRDPTDGSLEGLALLRADASSVTVGARHFSEFFIAGVADALLGNDVRTAFDPAVDMWQFPNVGTSVAPGGHCAGMSLTAMWFFVEQKPICDCSLRGRYDDEQAFTSGADTPDLWADDARGLRWATTVQKDVPWKGNGYYESAWNAMYEAQSNIQLGAFRFAMAVTHEPQFVLLSTPTGTPSHAMIAYGVTGDQLVVSDPNTPNKNPSYITYLPATGKFVPFVSGVIADGPTLTFDNIGYAAKSALFDWNRIGARFAEAEAGTIGMDRFDSFDLMAVELDENGMEVHNLLTAGYVPTSRNPIPVYAISLGRTLQVRATFYSDLSSVPGAVAEITTSADSTIPTSGTYALLDATSAASYGVLIEVWSVVGVDAAGVQQFSWRWADFLRFSFGTVAPPVTVPTTVVTPTSTVDCTQPPAGVPPSKLNQEYMDWWLQCHDIDDPFP